MQLAVRLSIFLGASLLLSGCTDSSRHHSTAGRISPPAGTGTPSSSQSTLPSNKIDPSGQSATDSATSVSARIDRCYVDTDGLAVVDLTATNHGSHEQDVEVDVLIRSKDGTTSQDAGVIHQIAPGHSGKGGTSNHRSGFQDPSCRITMVLGVAFQ